MEPLAPITYDQVREVQRTFGTPAFVYGQRALEQQARQVLAFPSPYGLTARYAMKALPAAAIIRLFNTMGLHIDASSEFEARRAVKAGVPPGQIQITAQQLPENLAELLDLGVLFTACSLNQLEVFGTLRPGAEACIRVNPGLGSGHNNRTNVGGPAASFGIWHEYLDRVFEVQRAHDLRITRMHTHIGSGSDPDLWRRCAKLSLDIAGRLPDIETLSLGGGFKVGRMPGEASTDLDEVGKAIARDVVAFYEEHGRRLALEIEPGAFLVANAGALVCTIIDVVDTGPSGYGFIKVDSGMTEILRPGLYGAQHPVTVVPATAETRAQRPYVVVGHCCESGDVLTPVPGDPEGLEPRMLTEPRIGDALVVGGAGAYCHAMSAKNYNSFPEAPEVLLTADGAFRLIRKRQTLDHMLANEVL